MAVRSESAFASRQDDRRSQILGLIRDTAFVRARDLSDRFGVSIVTVRADLDELARRGEIRRVRGGAVPVLRHPAETPYEARRDAYAAEKAAIARGAAALIEPGDTVLLDVGTTTMAIAREIVARPELDQLTVVTHGLNIAFALERSIPRVQVIVTGGSLRPLQHSLVDPLAGLVLDRLRASIAFVGADGIHPDHGISTTNLPEAQMKQRLVAAANRRVVVADASKFSRQALVRVCDLADVELILTAGEIDESMVAMARERTEVVIAAD